MEGAPAELVLTMRTTERVLCATNAFANLMARGLLPMHSGILRSGDLRTIAHLVIIVLDLSVADLPRQHTVAHAGEYVTKVASTFSLGRMDTV